MSSLVRRATLACTFSALGLGLSAAAQQPVPPKANGPFDGLSALKLRQIGPFRGGRVGAVAGVSGQPFVYYFGATGGGVFKTVMVLRRSAE